MFHNIIIEVVEDDNTFNEMLLELQKFSSLAVDTETVGKETEELLKEALTLSKSLREASLIHFCKFPPQIRSAPNYKPAKGSKTSYNSVKRAKSLVVKSFKKAYESLSGLHFWENDLGCIQIGTPNKIVYMIRPQCFGKGHWERLEMLLNTRQALLLANAVFDIKMLFQHTGILLDGRKIIDVQIAEWLLNNGKWFQKSLKVLCKKYLSLDLSKDKKVRISNWKENWNEKQLQYAALDVVTLFYIWEQQQKQIYIWGLEEALRLRCDFTTPCAIMDMSGIPIDVAGIQDYKTELEKRLNFQEFDLRLQWQVDEHFNFNSPIQIHQELTKLGLIVADTNEKTLKTTYPNDPRIEALLDYRETQKLLQVINKYLEVQRAGRVYTQFHITGTHTGRLSSGNSPNNYYKVDPSYVQGQNPPKGKFRTFIKPQEGREFLNADYSQIEIRWMAQLANDPVMIETYKQGQDLHEVTGKTVSKLSEEEWDALPKEIKKSHRQKAKAVNFGLLFGGGINMLINYALIQYQVVMDFFEASEIRRTWKELYSKVALFQYFHPKITQELGLVRTASGLIRFFEEFKYTDSLNTPVQGSAADGLINAINMLFYGLLDDGYTPLVDFWIPTVVHDEILLEYLAPYRSTMEKRLKESMINGMAQYLKLVPVEIEMSVVNSWAEKA